MLSFLSVSETCFFDNFLVLLSIIEYFQRHTRTQKNSNNTMIVKVLKNSKLLESTQKYSKHLRKNSKVLKGTQNEYKITHH